MFRLAVIGVLNTINYFVLFNILRVAGVTLFWSVTISFAVATLASYALNRRWTFGLSAKAGSIRETVEFYVVNAVAWGVTIVIVTGADHFFGPLGIIGENVASVVAAGIILVPKFASYRDVVFRRALRANVTQADPVSADADRA
jgi:putative flippase GtrA